MPNNRLSDSGGSVRPPRFGNGNETEPPDASNFIALTPEELSYKLLQIDELVSHGIGEQRRMFDAIDRIDGNLQHLNGLVANIDSEHSRDHEAIGELRDASIARTESIGRVEDKIDALIVRINTRDSNEALARVALTAKLEEIDRRIGRHSVGVDNTGNRVLELYKGDADNHKNWFRYVVQVVVGLALLVIGALLTKVLR